MTFNCCIDNFDVLRNGTPRQPLLVPSATGRFSLAQGIPGDVLEGLENYSHCWILYVFHKNTDVHHNSAKRMTSNPHTRGFKAKIAVPRLDGKKMGVFATRSPHRPSPVGLSVAKIESVSNGALLLSGVDIVDGSPVIDVKPYVPFCDSIQEATAPSWVDFAKVKDEPLSIGDVNIPQDVEGDIRECWRKIKGKSLYSTEVDFLKLVREVLSRDIRSLNQRVVLRKESSSIRYHVILEGIDIGYCIVSTIVTVKSACLVQE